MLSTRGHEPRGHSVSRAPPRPARRALGDGDGPSPRSNAPSPARRTHHFRTGCAGCTSVLWASRRRLTRQPGRPPQGPPGANPTAARSCDCTASSAHRLPPGAPTAPPSLFCVPHPRRPSLALAPTLQTNETGLYRRPPSAFLFSPPQRGRGSSDWPDVLGSPLSFTNH